MKRKGGTRRTGNKKIMDRKKTGEMKEDIRRNRQGKKEYCWQREMNKIDGKVDERQTENE